MAVRVSTRENGAETTPGVATAEKPVQLTEEQKKKLEDAFSKAITDTLGNQPVAWLSGGFSKA